MRACMCASVCVRVSECVCVCVPVQVLPGLLWSRLEYRFFGGNHQVPAAVVVQPLYQTAGNHQHTYRLKNQVVPREEEK